MLEEIYKKIESKGYSRRAWGTLKTTRISDDSTQRIVEAMEAAWTDEGLVRLWAILSVFAETNLTADGSRGQNIMALRAALSKKIRGAVPPKSPELIAAEAQVAEARRLLGDAEESLRKYSALPK